MIDQSNAGPNANFIRALLAPYLTANGLQAFRNLTSLLAATAIAQFCGLISVLLLTRSLGTDGYGIFAFALTIQNYLMILGSAGLRQILVRELVRRPESLSSLWTAYVTITGGFGILLAVLTIGAAAILAPTNSEQFVLTLIALGNVATCLSPLPFYDYRHAQDRSAVIMTISEVTAIGVLSALYITNSLSLSNATLVYTSKWIASVSWLWIAFQNDHPEVRWDWSKHEPVRLLASSWKLILPSLLGTIPLTAGILLVRFYHGNSAAGIFGVAMYAPRALLMVVGQFNRVLQPHIMGPYGFRPEFIGRLIFVYSMFVGIVAICGIAGLWFILTYILPAEFHAALGGAIIMLGASSLLALGALCVQYLVATNRERFVAMIYILMAVLYFLSAILLIPRDTVLGAAWSMIIAAVIMGSTSALALFVRRTNARDVINS